MIQGNFWITKLYKYSTAEEIATRVWDEPEIDHTTVGTYGYDVPMRPVFKGGGVNINYDTIASRVWNHDKAKGLLKAVNAIKIVTDKIGEYKDKIIGSIKDIIIPEIPEFPEMQELNLQPILDKIDKIKTDLKPVYNRLDDMEYKIDGNKEQIIEKIDAIPEFPAFPKIEDYTKKFKYLNASLFRIEKKLK